MRESATASAARTVLIDTGPLVAFLDRGDAHHRWAVQLLPRIEGRILTCEACIAEAMHLVENSAPAVERLRALAERMELAPALAGDPSSVFSSAAQFSPEMDLADACLVTLSRAIPGALVITTDTRHFSIYRVPFWSPRGLFAAGR